MKFHLFLCAAAFLICSNSLQACPEQNKSVAARDQGIQNSSKIQALNAWVRPSNGPTSAAYMELRNRQSQEEHLIEAQVPEDICGSVEIHTTLIEEGVHRMRPVKDLPIAAKSHIILQPGGLHIMLIDLKRPLKKGEMVPLTLIFKDLPPLNLQLPVGNVTGTQESKKGKAKADCECNRHSHAPIP